MTLPEFFFATAFARFVSSVTAAATALPCHGTAAWLVRRMREAAEEHALRTLRINRLTLDTLAPAPVEHLVVADKQLRALLSSAVDVERRAQP